MLKLDSIKIKHLTLNLSTKCNQNCSFCTVRYAVGKLRSRSHQEILSEFRSLVKLKYPFIALTADDTGSYGLDINFSFDKLLTELYLISSNKTSIILDELNPIWFVKYESTIKKYVKLGFINRIILPIQSASVSVLKSMKRYSDIDNLARIIKELLHLNPNLSLGSYILINFPTETNEDFEKTISFLKNLYFDTIWVLFYHINDSNYSIDKNIKKMRLDTINRELTKSNITIDISYE